MASAPSKVDLLGEVPLFARCSKKELKHLAPLVDEVRVPAGKVLISEGRGGEEAFVIVSGTASVTLDGTELRTVGAGETVGEMALLEPSALRSATVTATSEMELLVLGARAFNTVLTKHPEVTLKIAIGLAERLREAQQSVTD
jgi:CRP/FNR family cyclic AMP-dependent transcriptional regulator